MGDANQSNSHIEVIASSTLERDSVDLKFIPSHFLDPLNPPYLELVKWKNEEEPSNSHSKDYFLHVCIPLVSSDSARILLEEFTEEAAGRRVYEIFLNTLKKKGKILSGYSSILLDENRERVIF